MQIFVKKRTIEKMVCPKCGQAVSAEASFCMLCGQALHAGVVAPQAPMKKKTWIWAVLGVILLAIIGLFGYANLLGSKQKAEPQPVVLQARGAVSHAEVLPVEQKAPEKIVMPDDVKQWLLHLERIEKKKNELSSKQAAQMLVYMTQLQGAGAAMGILQGDENTSPSTAAGQKFETLRTDWNNLLTEYNAVQPPAECQELASNFYRAVSEIPGITSDLMTILSGSGSDPAGALQKLEAIQNKSADNIDKYLILSDGQLGTICQKYDTQKWFSIESDTGGGLLGATGMKR